MPHLKLFHYPLRACSHVTFTALVQTGLPFEEQAVDIRLPDRKPEHLQASPEGKVPALLVDGKPLVENVAILTYLHALVPDAGLLPPSVDPVVQAQQCSDLVWISATLHPAVRQARMPSRFTDDDPSGVRAKGVEFTTAMFGRVEQRLASNSWWYGEAWSIVDVYLCWAFTTAASTELLSVDDYPAIMGLMARVKAQRNFQASVEQQMASKESHGIEFPDVWKPI